MKKWQEERNYRRVRNEGGEVIANIITVDGMDVEVPEDVYLAYAQADRRERYITEEQSSGKLLSLEQMEEDALLPDYVGAETAPSAETEALEREDLRNLAEQKQILLLALPFHGKPADFNKLYDNRQAGNRAVIFDVGKIAPVDIDLFRQRLTR